MEQKHETEKEKSEEISPNDQSLSSRKNIIIDEELFDCPLCTSLLYKPITTSCGHTFCQACALRIMDHDNKCPLCRTVLHITPSYKVSVLLDQVIKNNFPEQYEQRRLELEKELNDQKFNLPLFGLGDLVLFPKSQLPLHVFEPRYRLMIRRCLEGCRSFGVVPTINGQLQAVGCVAIIENHYVFPDGRNLIATNGGERFRVLSTFEMDGYTVAKVEYLRDEVPANGIDGEELQSKYLQAKKLMEDKFSSAIHQLEEKFGPVPTNPEGFTWWVASVLPLASEKKYAILCMDSPLTRMNKILDYLHVDQSSCIIC